MSSDLKSAISYFQVLVMDSGIVSEYDTVPKLLANPKSSFRAMVVEAGLDDTVTGPST